MTRAEALVEARKIVGSRGGPCLYLHKTRDGSHRVMWDDLLGTMCIPNIIGKGDSWEDALSRVRANMDDVSLDGPVWRDLRAMRGRAMQRSTA